MNKLAILLLLVANLASAANWGKKPASAMKKAEKENKCVLLLFTGKSWCVFCTKLEKEVFSKKEFDKFAKGNLILVELNFDFGKKGRKDFEELKKEHNVTGFPSTVLLSPKGEVLTSGGYKTGNFKAEDYISEWKSFTDEFIKESKDDRKEKTEKVNKNADKKEKPEKVNKNADKKEKPEKVNKKVDKKEKREKADKKVDE